MNIAAPDFSCMWAEAFNIPAYLKTRLLHKYLLSSTTLFDSFQGKRLTISHLKLFRSKSYRYIGEEQHPSGSKYIPSAHEAIIVGYTSSPECIEFSP
jgi:hypothetical protein